MVSLADCDFPGACNLSIQRLISASRSLRRDGDSEQVFWRSWHSGYPNMVIQQLLKRANFNQNFWNENGSRLLLWSASRGYDQLVQLLLGKGADVNGRDWSWGRTALHQAANKGHKTVVEVLLGRGANVNGKDHEGFLAIRDEISDENLKFGSWGFRFCIFPMFVRILDFILFS